MVVMNAALNGFLSEFKPQLSAIESSLDHFTRPQVGCPQRLCDAVRYSVLAPGKRLRPLLTLVACHAVGGNWQDALPQACAVEFIHAYSLIHDDLPAMDDDDLRRGRPSCHREFDEATAILAGDCLQTLAFEVICEQSPPQIAVASASILARAAGRCHLVGGQADDLAAEGRYGPLTVADKQRFELLRAIHRRKTGALIEASLRLGGVAGGASMDHLERLGQYGLSIGLAFQIVDDCLDVESTAAQMGKNTRKDQVLGKLTYPEILGLAESHALAEQLVSDAVAAISVLDTDGQLSQLARFIVDRRS